MFLFSLVIFAACNQKWWIYICYSIMRFNSNDDDGQSSNELFFIHIVELENAWCVFYRWEHKVIVFVFFLELSNFMIKSWVADVEKKLNVPCCCTILYGIRILEIDNTLSNNTNNFLYKFLVMYFCMAFFLMFYFEK